MVEDVLKGNSRAGPDENNRLQVDVRFLDRERLSEVARAAVARGNFLKLGKRSRYPARSGSACGNGSRLADQAATADRQRG